MVRRARQWLADVQLCKSSDPFFLAMAELLASGCWLLAQNMPGVLFNLED